MVFDFSVPDFRMKRTTHDFFFGSFSTVASDYQNPRANSKLKSPCRTIIFFLTDIFLFDIGQAPSILSAQAFRAIGLIVGPLIYLCLFCLLGQLVTNRSQAVSIAAYASHWYDYSLNLRKYILMTIAYSQIDFNMMALGFVHCNMVSFKKVTSDHFVTNVFSLDDRR